MSNITTRFSTYIVEDHSYTDKDISLTATTFGKHNILSSAQVFLSIEEAEDLIIRLTEDIKNIGKQGA